MEKFGFVRLSGATAIAGGALWALFAVLASLKPVGCIAATCAMRPMRYTTDLAPIAIPAVLLLFTGFVGLVLYARASGRLSRLMKAGLVAMLTGSALLAIAMFIQGIFYAGDFFAMPTLVIPGAAALALGLLAVGIALLSLMPRWVGALLVGSAIALAFANDQDARVLLYVPFGLSWIAIGIHLLSHSRAPDGLAGRVSNS